MEILPYPAHPTTFNERGVALKEAADSLQTRVARLNKQIILRNSVQDYADKIESLHIGSILTLVAGCLLGFGALISLFTVSPAFAGVLAIASLVVLVVSLCCFIAMKVFECLHTANNLELERLTDATERDQLQIAMEDLRGEIRTHNRDVEQLSTV